MTSSYVKIPNVLHVSGLCKNLLSIRYLAKDLKCVLQLDEHGFRIKEKDGGTRLLGNSDTGLYMLETDTNKGATTTLTSHRVSPSVWHNRLGHPAQPILRKILSQIQSSIISFCTICITNKARCLTFFRRTYTTTTPFELVHIDLCGPSPATSREGFHYYASIIEDYFRYLWFIPLRFKSEFVEHFIWFCII